ncbi:MAG TPA: fluoride efflux transporter CrcB [Steroidobacteraceae bacterium]|jgi:CrcB protein|nr:fluoride efflux transporter CrcB [Steroidobacteraceae bacterium]
MTGTGIFAVGVGAAGGAWLRWILGVFLNTYFPSVPPGTLAANLIGGYVIGAAIAFFSQTSGIAPEWRLLIITGFCGGLTTFSTFSAEITALLQQGRLGLFSSAIALHVGGSLLMTLAGIATWRWLAAR